jgi:hypothetical protein
MAGSLNQGVMAVFVSNAFGLRDDLRVVDSAIGRSEFFGLVELGEIHITGWQYLWLDHSRRGMLRITGHCVS